MERSELKRRALLAAMSVTLALGCRTPEKVDGGTLTDVSGADTDAPAEETLPADSDDAPTDTDAPSDTDLPDTDLPPTDPQTPSDTDVAAPAPSWERGPDCAAQGLDFEQCCDARRLFCGTQHLIGSTPYDDCVFGPGFDGSTGCIPWGPPTPPAARALT
jgi:hypothetical protein